MRKEYLENEKLIRNTFLLCKWDIIKQKKQEKEAELMLVLKQRRSMRGILVIKSTHHLITSIFAKFNDKRLEIARMKAMKKSAFMIARLFMWSQKSKGESM